MPTFYFKLLSLIKIIKMDNESVIKQGVDICVNQIDYIEFGLKQSKNTPYLVTAINIVNHIIKNYYDVNYRDRQNLIPLLHKIGIKI